MQPRAPLERSKVRISVAILVTMLGILGLIGGLTAGSARAKTAAAQLNGGTVTPFGTPTWTNTPVPTAAACGLEWQVVPSPNGPSVYTVLYDVAAISANDVWAVGYFWDQDACTQRPWLQHWDGAAWTQYQTTLGDGILSGVSAVSANDIWAVGGYIGGALTLHYDGSTWSLAPTPVSAHLNDVAAVSASEAYAVGRDYDGPIALRWNGTFWTESNMGPELRNGKAEAPESFPANLFSVTAAGSNNIWAVGTIPFGSYNITLVTHFNGTSWSLVGSPSPGTYFNSLQGIDALAPNDIWAVGYYSNCYSYCESLTLTLHWNGSQWTRIDSPNPRSEPDNPTGVPSQEGSEQATGSTSGTGGTDRTSDKPASTTSTGDQSDGCGPPPGPRPDGPSGEPDNNSEYLGNFLQDVTVVSPTEVWAVGHYNRQDYWQNRTVALRWDGTQWTQTNTISNFTNNQFFGVDAVASGHVWAVGRVTPQYINDQYTLTERFGPACQSGTPGPTATPTVCNNNYDITTDTDTIVPGTTDIGNHCYGCTTPLTLPWPIQLYDRIFTTANVSSYGNIQFGSNSTSVGSCLPFPGFQYTIIAHGDSIRTDNPMNICPQCGVFTSVTGSAPNRVFHVEWRAKRVGSSPETGYTNFEVRFFEGSPNFRVVYGEVAYNGRYTSIGVQRMGNTSFNIYNQFACRTENAISAGMALDFTQPSCSVPLTSTPTATPTACSNDYAFSVTQGATVVTGTTDIGNHCDECTTQIALPFPHVFYGVPHTTANVGSNGIIQFDSANGGWTQSCMPLFYFNNAIYPLFYDMRTDGTGGVGIFTSVTGSAPNRVFNIEWRTCVSEDREPCTGIETNFVTKLYEGQSRVDVVYGTLHDYSAHYGTVGVQKGQIDRYTQYYCGANNNLRPGMTISFTQASCGVGGTPTTMPATNTPTRTGTPAATATGVPGAPTNTPAGTGTPTTAPATTTGTPAAPTDTPTAQTTAQPNCLTGFTDVPPGSTFYDQVMCLSCHGMINGYADGTFRPGNPITRGQLAKIVANTAGFTEPVSGQTFEDVASGSTFYVYIERMVGRGMISGYACGSDLEPCSPENRPYFRPGANATRGQIAKIVSNAANISRRPGDQQMFMDVPEESPFYMYVQGLASRQVMNGYPCGGTGEPCDEHNMPYFRPYNNATRGQVSKIVSNTFYGECAGMLP